MSTYVYINMFTPGDAIFITDDAGKVTAFKVFSDGTLNPVDISVGLELAIADEKAPAVATDGTDDGV